MSNKLVAHPNCPRIRRPTSLSDVVWAKSVMLIRPPRSNLIGLGRSPGVVQFSLWEDTGNGFAGLRNPSPLRSEPQSRPWPGMLLALTPLEYQVETQKMSLVSSMAYDFGFGKRCLALACARFTHPETLNCVFVVVGRWNRANTCSEILSLPCLAYLFDIGHPFRVFLFTGNRSTLFCGGCKSWPTCKVWPISECFFVFFCGGSYGTAPQILNLRWPCFSETIRSPTSELGHMQHAIVDPFGPPQKAAQHDNRVPRGIPTFNNAPHASIAWVQKPSRMLDYGGPFGWGGR